LALATLNRGKTNSAALENVEQSSSWRYIILQVLPKARQKLEAPNKCNENLKPKPKEPKPSGGAVRLMSLNTVWTEPMHG